MLFVLFCSEDLGRSLFSRGLRVVLAVIVFVVMICVQWWVIRSLSLNVTLQAGSIRQLDDRRSFGGSVGVSKDSASKSNEIVASKQDDGYTPMHAAEWSATGSSSHLIVPACAWIHRLVKNICSSRDMLKMPFFQMNDISWRRFGLTCLIVAIAATRQWQPTRAQAHRLLQVLLPILPGSFPDVSLPEEKRSLHSFLNVSLTSSGTARAIFRCISAFYVSMNLSMLADAECGWSGIDIF